MLFEVRLGSEQSPLAPVGCGSSGREMAENGTVDRSSTTFPAPFSPSNHKLASVAVESAQTANSTATIGPTDGQQKRMLASPPCNGYSSPISKGNDDAKNSALIPSTAIEAQRVKCENVTCGTDPHSRSRQLSGKPASEQDGPLDFSLRRRDSLSETFTDDSRASSSVSPPMTSITGQPRITPSSRLSPELESGHHYQHIGLSHSQAQNHDSSPHSRPNTSHSAGAGSSDPEPIGQPKTALPMTSSAGGGSRSPSGSSLGHMGLLQDGSPSNIAAAAAAAMLGQNGAMMGPLGNLTAFMTDPRRVQGANGGKVQRPFKAYPKEALQMPLGYLGMPGMNPFASMELGGMQGLTVSQEELMNIYKQQLEFLKERDKQLMSISKMITGSAASSTPSTSSSTATSNGSNSSSITAHQPSSSTPSALPSSAPSPYFPHTSPPTNPQLPPAPSSLSNSYSPGAHTPLSNTPFPPSAAHPLVSSTSSLAGGSSRKRPRTLPDNQKDEAYWERRRKNNDAAKRSRDARRAKEDEIAIRAALLEQENLKLRVEVAALKTETARLRCMLYNS